MPTRPLNEEETNIMREQLHGLQLEHRDLDLVITHLIENPAPDDLLVRRLKKRKLALKDQILLLEKLLVPDISA